MYAWRLGLGSVMTRRTVPLCFPKRKLHFNAKLLQDKISSGYKKPPMYQASLIGFSKKLFKYTFYVLLGTTGYFAYSIYSELHPSEQQPQTITFENGSPRKKLIILGTGWGAVSLLQKLDTTKYNVTVISPRNFFLFTPLLPSTPVGNIDLKSIMEPIRHILRRKRGEVQFVEAKATDINPVNKTIEFVNRSNKTKTISYDYLVVSVGAESTTFQISGVRENAIFMKEAIDSERIKNKIFENIEKACLLDINDPNRKKLLSFVVVGGGPTGVEIAAELQDYVSENLKKWIPAISNEISVSLIEALPNILNVFDKSLIEYTEEFIQKSKINLMLNTFVKKVDENNITASISDQLTEIPYGLLIWATGIQPRDITRNLMLKLPKQQTDHRGLLINDKLQILGAEQSVFAIGDCTFHKGWMPTAQVAHQEGYYLANIFNELYILDQLNWQILQAGPNEKLVKKLQKKIEKTSLKIPNFVYSHRGTLAYIGSERAIVEVRIAGKDYHLRGSPFAFLFWKTVYLSMCVSLRSRIMVSLDWFKVYFFGRDSV